MKSLMSLSMHKAGSSIADLIIVDFCTELNMEIDRISKQVPVSKLEEAKVYINYQDKMVSNDCYYGMARGIYVGKMTVLSDLRLIIQVRDPRDCITSGYFSFKVSHVPPKDPEKIKNFENLRKVISKMTIDDYAISNADNYKIRMRILSNIMKKHNDMLFLRYEEMVLDTDSWLNKISKFLDQPITSSLLDKLGNKVDFRVDKEDISKHKRQVVPGDHVRKLKSETIKKMNDVMKDELIEFGYF